MVYKNRSYFIVGLFIVSILFILSQLFLYSRGFYSLSADEAGHTLEAYNWYLGNSSIFSIWLPFQKILLGLVFNLYHNLFWAPRILSSLFGLLTILFLVFLAYELFQNIIVSLLTGFLGSIFSCLVIFSVIPMTEIYFFFFVIGSIACLLHWKRTKYSLSLLSSIILSSIGTTTRYEAWIFSLVIFFAITMDIYSIKGSLTSKLLKVFCLFILLFVFPIYWIHFSYNTTGEASSFIHSVVERYSRGGEIAEIKNNVLYNFFYINIASLNILGFITLLFLYKKEPRIKLYVQVFLVTLLVMSLITFFTKAMPTHHSWRIAAIWSIMLLPFTAQWLYISLTDEKLYMKLNFFLSVILLIFYFLSQTNGYTKNSYMTREDLAIGNYINRYLCHKDNNSKIYIERDNWRYTSILIASQNPDRFIINGNYNNIINQIGNRGTVTSNDSDIEYFILKAKTRLKADSKDFEDIKDFKDWTIYKFH